MSFPFLKSRRIVKDGAFTPRIYAIGDLHGRLDLFDKMIGIIRRDTQLRTARPIRIIVLGDFIDRGPESAKLVNLLMRLRHHSRVVVLKGNHEAAMVDAMNGDHAALDLWLMHGGIETLRSFGVEVDSIDLEDSMRLLRLARAAISPAILSWMQELPTFVRFDRYYFVHAGIQPGVPLADQSDASRLWIADEFTSSPADHGAVIVHGHTIHDNVFIGHNRIAVDTGAYQSGRLSAVVIENDQIDVLTAEC